MKGPMQIVNCFVEEWEEEAKLKQDAVSEAKTLKKYSGLEWIDIDNDVLCHVGDTIIGMASDNMVGTFVG